MLGTESYEVIRIQHDTDLMLYWPHITREMDRIPQVWDTWWTKEALLQQILCGGMQLWGVGPPNQLRLIAITQVNTYPANRILQIVLVLGNSLHESAPVLAATLQKFAHLQGCLIGEVVGRPGWEKFLAPHGFRKTAVVLTARLGAIREQ